MSQPTPFKIEIAQSTINAIMERVRAFEWPDAPEGGGWDGVAVPHYGAWGFDTAGMDTSVKPGDSMFQYANGKAAAAMVIPSDRPRFGAFDTLSELSQARLRKIVEG